MASLGFTGAPALTVEGEDAKSFWDDLGERWETSNTHYKAYPVCRWAHPAIDAAAEMMTEHGLVSTDIKRARIRTFHYATRLAGHEPKTLDELAYSLAFPFAIMIVRGRIGPDELTEATLNDPEILRISRGTAIVESEHYTRISTDKRWADITLYLEDGRELQSAPRTPRGDPDNPLSTREVSDKFHLLADSVIGAERASMIEQQVSLVGDEGFEIGDFLSLIFDKK
jgi:2-methylcitrate dehydratase PrpD